MPDPKTVLTIAGAALDAIDVVGGAIDTVLGKNPTLEEALAVLGAISRVAKSIQAGLDGKPVDVGAEIAALQGAVAANNQVIDAEIDTKFPKG
jgi:hypothetical protein